MTTDLDVLVVGAGISGINLAYRLTERCPDLSFQVLDAREEIGGTWDLFRYPGIRSDSDFFTLSFPFRPWRGEDAIVSGEAIMDYLHETVDATGLRSRIQLGTKVLSADWSSQTSRWTVKAVREGEPVTYSARFVVACTGYYDYDNPHDPGFGDPSAFGGEVVHPQFWPTDLDVSGKRVAVVGSGATAVTLVPALAEAGASVTMVQRTPTYVLAQPKSDALANGLRKVLAPDLAHQIVRTKNTALQWGLYQACKNAPDLMRSLLRKGAIAATGSEAVVDEHFNPPYGPWDQRLCIAPGGDLYESIRNGQASVVTGAVKGYVPTGVELDDGRVVEADVVVTATGLRIKLLGGIDLSVDGETVDLSQRHVYLGAMLSGLPNAGFCIGYINLSWTMRSDMTARLLTRVLRRLVDERLDVVMPVAPAGLPAGGPVMDMPSGYLARAASVMPRATDTYPWAMAQNVVKDAWHTNRADLDDGLVWSRASQSAGVPR